jgi:hypothetical protein
MKKSAHSSSGSRVVAAGEVRPNAGKAEPE